MRSHWNSCFTHLSLRFLTRRFSPFSVNALSLVCVRSASFVRGRVKRAKRASADSIFFYLSRQQVGPLTLRVASAATLTPDLSLWLRTHRKRHTPARGYYQSAHTHTRWSLSEGQITRRIFCVCMRHRTGPRGDAGANTTQKLMTHSRHLQFSGDKEIACVSWRTKQRNRPQIKLLEGRGLKDKNYRWTRGLDGYTRAFFIVDFEDIDWRLKIVFMIIKFLRERNESGLESFITNINDIMLVNLTL